MSTFFARFIDLVHRTSYGTKPDRSIGMKWNGHVGCSFEGIELQERADPISRLVVEATRD